MFTDRTAIITGGSSGIGEALALKLAGRGARLALVARDPSRLAAVREKIAAQYPGARVEVFSCDVSDEAAARETVAEIAERLGPPGLLINSAGILIAQYFHLLPTANFREQMEVNFFGTLHMIKAALPYLEEERGSRIVNISSVAGALGVFGYSSYCASKHALVGLTGALRAELKPRGVRVHLVLPPETKTPMLEQVNKNRIPENKALAETIPALPVERVAEETLRGIERNRYLIIPGLQARLMIRLGQVMPGLERRIVDYAVKKTYRGPGGGKSS